jgi:hypothetical protein
MMRGLSIFFIILSTVACDNTDKYKAILVENGHPNKINDAAFHLGEARDTSAVRLLLTGIADPGISHDIRYKGMSVCYCRLGALKKISGQDFYRRFNQFRVDTEAISFYIDWAIKSGHLRNKADIDINPKD